MILKLSSEVLLEAKLEAELQVILEVSSEVCLEAKLEVTSEEN